MGRRAWLLVVAVLLAGAVWLPAGAAGAHSGEWVARYCWGWWGWWVCGWEWQPHDHEAENRRKREKECYEQYQACCQLCQILYQGSDPDARYKRSACYRQCMDDYARCLRGR